MDATSFLVAAFAPLTLWLLWRIQSVAIDQALRRGMYGLLRYQRRTYNVVSWVGVLLHELSHAFFLLLGGHGIKDFKVRTDGGHVTPHQVRRGPLGLLTFLVAALAPMFVAPAILFVVAWRLLDSGLVEPAHAGLGWDAAWPVLRDTATDMPVRLARLLVGLDVATGAGATVFLLAVFAMPSARPSFVPGKRGAQDEGDIAVVRRKVRRQPIPPLVVLALLYASYFLVPLWPAAYWGAWQVAWSISLTATLLAVLLGLAWVGVAWAGRIRAWLAWVPFATGIAIQLAGRQTELALWIVNLATVAAFTLLSIGLWAVAPRRY